VNEQENFLARKKNDKSSEILVSDLLRVLNSSKKFIIFVTLLAILSMIVLWAISPIKYKASALLAVAQPSQTSSIPSLGGLGGLAGFAGINLGEGGSNIKTSVAIFKSRMFIEGYIKDEDLLKKLFFEDWDNNKKKWRADPPSIRSGFSVYRGMMEIMETGGLYRVTFTGPNPEIVEALTNNSVKRLNNYSRQQAIKESMRSIEYLEDQLDQTNVKNSQVFLYNLIEEQTKQIMLATSRQEFIFKFIDPAIVPTSKYSPILSQYVFIGFWIGLLFSTFSLVLLETFGIKIPNKLKD